MVVNIYIDKISFLYVVFLVVDPGHVGIPDVYL